MRVVNTICDYMRDILKIIERMRIATRVENDVQLSNYLQIKANTITTWKARGKVPYEHLDEISQGESVSFDWLLTGEGPMHRATPGQELIAAEDSPTYVAEVAKMLSDMPEDSRKRIFEDTQREKLFKELMRTKEEGEKDQKVG